MQGAKGMPRRMGSRLLTAAWVVCLLLAPTGVSTRPTESQDAQHPMEAVGKQPGRGAFSQFPWESVDTYSGSVVLTFNDLVLPNNGFDLRILRTYNSKHGGWRVRFGPTIFHGPAGDLYNNLRPNPKIVTEHGSEVMTFETSPGSNTFRTTSYWMLHLYEETPGVLAEYRLFKPDGTRYYFHPDGRLDYMEDLFGNWVDVNYGQDEQGHLKVILTQYILGNDGERQREVTLRYDGSGSVTSVVEGDRTWTYQYEAGRMTVAEGPAGVTWHFAYDGVFNITVTTPNGGTVRYEYGWFPRERRRGEGLDPQTLKVRYRTTGGREIQNRGSAGTWEFIYHDNAGLETSVQGPSQRIRYAHRGFGQNGIKLIKISKFTAADTGETSPLEETSLTWVEPQEEVQAVGEPQAWPNPYDDLLIRDDPFPMLPRGALVRRWEPESPVREYSTTYGYRSQEFNDYGHPTTVTETGQFQRVTTRTYRHDFASYTRARPDSETISQEGQTYTTSFVYDSSARLTSKTANGVTTSYGYHAFGMMADSTDANNHTTSYTYDWGVLKKTATPAYTVARTINGDGTIASESRDGHATTYQYDAIGRETVKTPPDSADIASTTTAYYEDRIEVTFGTSCVTTHLDGFGRTLWTENAEGVRTRSAYDPTGRKTYESLPYYNEDPNAPDVGTSYSYDALGRVTQRTNADGTSITYSYANTEGGPSVTAVDEAGRSTTQNWAATGDPSAARLVSVVDGAGQTWSYEYDLLGALTRVAQPGGLVRTWEYTGEHWLGAETHPESGRTEYGHDNVGNVTSRKTGVHTEDEMTVSFSYDGNNRLTWAGDRGTAYEYDAFDRRTRMNRAGVVDTSFVYDAGGGRLRRRTDDVMVGGESRHFETGYDYDPGGVGVPRRVSYPSGHHVCYAHDMEGRITKVWQSSSPECGEKNTLLVLADDLSYHPSGALWGVTAGGVTQTFSYDRRLRPLSYASANVLEVDYSNYDGVGNLLSMRQRRPGQGWEMLSFSYDNLDRLTSASGPWGSSSYEHDALGNRTRVTRNDDVLDYTYRGDTKWIAEARGPGGALREEFEHTATGNLKRDGLGQYVHSGSNMLAEVTLAAGPVHRYAYDGDDQRVWRQSANRSTYYIHGLGGLLSEFERDGEAFRWMVDYVYLGGRLLAALRADEPVLSIEGGELAEGQSGTTLLRFAVRLSAASQATVTVPYSTSAGTATAGIDYTTMVGTLTIPAQQTVGFIDVPVHGDTTVEPTETFFVTLGPPTNAILRPEAATATGVIINDDGGPVFTDDPLVARETEIKAQHFVELRQYIDQLRGQRGLGGRRQLFLPVVLPQNVMLPDGFTSLLPVVAAIGSGQSWL